MVPGRFAIILGKLEQGIPELGQMLLADTGRVIVSEKALEQLGELDMLLECLAVPLTERNLCFA